VKSLTDLGGMKTSRKSEVEISNQ